MSLVTIKGIYTEYQELITVAPDDTLGHAANLLRQHQFHHLPVVRSRDGAATWHWPGQKKTPLVFEGLLTSQDIDMVVALERESQQESTRDPLYQRRRCCSAAGGAQPELPAGRSLRVAARTGRWQTGRAAGEREEERTGGTHGELAGGPAAAGGFADAQRSADRAGSLAGRVRAGYAIDHSSASWEYATPGAGARAGR